MVSYIRFISLLAHDTKILARLCVYAHAISDPLNCNTLYIGTLDCSKFKQPFKNVIELRIVCPFIRIIKGNYYVTSKTMTIMHPILQIAINYTIFLFV